MFASLERTTPGVNDERHGKWARKQLVKMNNRALARMASVHPKLIPPELRALLGWPVDKPANKVENTPSGHSLGAETDNFVPVDNAGVLTGQQVAREVASRCGMSVTEMLTKRRVPRLVAARQLAAYEMAVRTNLSLPQIGRVLCQEHTTVLSSIRAYAWEHGLPLPRGMDFGGHEKKFRRLHKYRKQAESRE